MQRLLTLLILLLFMIPPTWAQETNPGTFTLHTNAFVDGGPMPVLYTCDGKNISPFLEWEHLPNKTQSLAVIVIDPDAPGGIFYHWLLYNIPTSMTSLSEGMTHFPTNVLLGKNSFGKLAYSGPCPPKGASHTYLFTLYALDSLLKVDAGVDGNTLVKTIKEHELGETTLTTVYSRWLQ